MTTIKDYASWPSTLTAEVLAKKGKRYGHMDIDNGSFYWIEVRAEEKGRGVLMCANPQGNISEVLPSDVSVRTRVHEYGGGDFTVVNQVVYFSNALDNRIYLFDGKLQAITPESMTEPDLIEVRFADFTLTPDEKFLIAVRETHQSNSVINELVSINLAQKSIKVIHSGFDFYSFPRISAAGHRVCWTCWNQPDMPWDAAELWLADIHKNGDVDAAHKVCGGDNVSVFQPEWSQDGVLHYISDASGWNNIYSQRDGILNALTPIDRDFGTPQWIFGLGTYVINNDGSIFALNFEAGQQRLCHIDPLTGHIEPIALPFKSFSGALLGDESYLYFCAASPAKEVAMYRYDIQQRTYQELTQPAAFPLTQENISIAESISFPSPSTEQNKRIAHGFYYAPKNSEYVGEENSTPPLIVMSHGGPTAYCDNGLNPAIQFWTNRGFAVVDVNYSGSTGYGRRYQERLTNEWGVVDVEDCIAAANYLVEKKLANKNQLLIRGGSAGGYTTLCALTFHDVFAAGMSRYGVADLESLASDSHKFEARYLDKMVGAYPEKKALYQERSPIHYTDKLSCPILLLQGSEDKVVPPNQAEMMVEALQQKKIPYAYLLFQGEGHGFRQSETIIQAFNAELYFYRKILGIDSEEQLPEIVIQNC